MQINRTLPSTRLFVVVIDALGFSLPILLQSLRTAAGIVQAPVYTTRSMRLVEDDGVDYRRLQPVEFLRLMRCGAFLELFNYNGDLFGIRSADIYELARSGINICAPLRSEAADRLKAAYPDRVFRILLHDRITEEGIPHHQSDCEFKVNTWDLSHGLFDLIRKIEPYVDLGIDKD